MTQTKHVSEATAKVIDAEVRRIVDTGYDRARKILEDGIDELHAVAGALLEYETLSGDEIIALLEGREIVCATAEEPVTDAGKRSSVPPSGAKGAPGDLEPELQPGS